MPAVRGSSCEILDDVEAVDVRHHQVEHDEIRDFALRHEDGLAAAVRAEDRPGHRLDAEGDELHRLRVVVHDEDLERAPLCPVRHGEQPENRPASHRALAGTRASA